MAKSEFEFKTVKIIIEDRRDRKTYEKMIADGWEVDHILNHTVFRGATYKLQAAPQEVVFTPHLGHLLL